MTIRNATYRNYAYGPWDTEPVPGPLPQVQTRKYATSRTYCTCGHSGQSHNPQTLTVGLGFDRTGQHWVDYSEGTSLRFQGNCIAWVESARVPDDWYNCPCTWFLEDMEKVKEEKAAIKEKKRKKRAKAKAEANLDAGIKPAKYKNIVW